MSKSEYSKMVVGKHETPLDHSDSITWGSNRQPIVLGVLTTICVALFLAGCTQSTLRDLPSFLSNKSKGPSFAELSKSETTRLTIWHESFEEAQAASQASGKQSSRTSQAPIGARGASS